VDKIWNIVLVRIVSAQSETQFPNWRCSEIILRVNAAIKRWIQAVSVRVIRVTNGGAIAVGVLWSRSKTWLIRPWQRRKGLGHGKRSNVPTCLWEGS